MATVEDAKKKRAGKARVVTRRVNEVLNALKSKLQEDEIVDKINNLKYAIGELGNLHDDVITIIEEAAAPADKAPLLQTEDTWYNNYDKKVNLAIKEAREHIDLLKEAADAKKKMPVKIKKLDVPKFKSEPKSYYKWKETFLRYTNGFDNEVRYDYLFSHTEGEAHTYVANRRTFQEAIDKLDEKFGNVHEIIGMLVDEVKSVPAVRRGDFVAFEKVSMLVNDFHDKLVLMGKDKEVENSYILKEVESKLCSEDLQRWLESEGDHVDDRTVKNLLKWLETQTRLRRIAGKNTRSPEQSQIAPDGFSSNVATTSKEVSTELKCLLCSTAGHGLKNCPAYLRLSLHDRWEKLKSLRACFICLKTRHLARDCTASHCEVCSGPHHKTIHNYANKGTRNPADTPNPNPNPILSGPAGDTNGPKRCYLPIVKSKIVNGSNRAEVTTILDSGSELTIITPKYYELLKLKGIPTNVSIIGAGGVTTTLRTKLVEFYVEDNLGVSTLVEGVVLQKACGKALPLDPTVIKECKTRYKIDESKLVTEGGKIDLLLGMSVPNLHRQLHVEEMSNGLNIWYTRFGPCVVGPTPIGSNENYTRQMNRVTIVPETEFESMREHLASELAGINTDNTKVLENEEDSLFKEKMEKGLIQDSNGRLTVSLPWRDDPEILLENNRSQAEMRDKNLMKKIKEDPKIYQLFHETVDDMVKEGIWREVQPDVPKRFLPVLTVVDLNRETTKIRVCLDAKSKFKGVSVNDALLKGTVDVIDIFEAVTKARCGRYAMAGDMKKMFWQVALSPEDQLFHGVICDGKTYICTRVSYGDKPSPAIADFSMKKIVVYGKEEYPLGSQVVEKRRYVDDLQDADSSVQKMIKKRDETNELLGKFKFEIKTWLSNHPLIGDVKEENKMLGVRWNAVKDTLSPKMQGIGLERRFDKRNVLSVISSFWDPQGLLAGLLVTGRLIFQAIVRMKYEWDAMIEDPELEEKWTQWISEVDKCDNMSVDRSLMPSSWNENSHAMLIGFSDGSSVAHGCTAYLRWSDGNDDNIEVKFLGAKGRVNPIKGTTTPRAEMLGAFILSRLMYSVESAISETDIWNKIVDKRLYTDSTTVVSWIKSAAIKYKPFVRNKIIEMQELHPTKVWKHIPRSKNESADLISKGCSRNDLEKIIRGPDFLYTSKDGWIEDYEDRDYEEEDCEKIDDFVKVGTAVIEEDPAIDISRFSSWKKLVNVTAYCYKFGKKKGEEINEDQIPSITEEERCKAENYWIRLAQKDLPPDDKVKTLCPFIDDHGVKRINGRIGRSKMFDYDEKFPVLLPKNHKVSELIVLKAHDDVIHQGHSRVIAEVRKRYWIIGLRSMAKRIGRKCVLCRKWRGVAMEQFMRDLPECRTSPGIPFETTAVDYFGPFHIKYGYRGKKKVYGAIFTCLATRAISVELVTDLTTDRFLMALQRFMSLYGQPRRILSDNGSNFIGAANEIRALIGRWKKDQLEKKKLTDFCNDNNIEWTFSTPLAPHHNGCVESMVKSVKNVLNKIVRQHVLTEEEYRTVLAQVSTCVNSRPLWPSNDDNLDNPITPISLLRPSGLPIDPEYLNVQTDIRRRYQRVQSVADEWWKLWMQNFVPNLQARTKWFKQRENVGIDDIVLIIEKDVVRSKWNMGRIVEVYPGPDGLVRSVKLRTASGIYNRPITKLVLLLSKEELAENENW